MAGLGDIGAGLGDAIGTLIGIAMANGDYEEADRLRAEAEAIYGSVQVPDASQLERMGRTNLGGVEADPRAREARLRALRELEDTVGAGGLDPQARAAMAEARQEAGAYESAQRGAIMGDAARRGVGGSAMTVGATLDAQAKGADRLGMEGVQAAGDASSRRLQALNQLAGVGGDIERDEYRIDSTRELSQDAIDRFNASESNRFLKDRFGMDVALADRRYDSKRDRGEDYERKGNRTVDRARGIGRAGGRTVGTAGDYFIKSGGGA